MIDKLFFWLLRHFVPMFDGGASLYYVYAALAAAGTAVQVQNQAYANNMRQQQLEEELRSRELAALDEENQRLMALREANQDLLVRAGGVDAWASPSLIAARNFNFKMGMEDIENIRLNLQQSRSSVANRIAVLKRNTRATQISGIFEVAGIFAQAGAAGKQLGKTGTKSIPTDGSGGINADLGVGILDTPGGTGVLG